MFTIKINHKYDSHSCVESNRHLKAPRRIVKMSVLGQERTKHQPRIMSAFGGKADEIAGKADIKPAGLRFSRLITHFDNGCMGWSEIVRLRFTGPVYQTRERFSAAMPQKSAPKRAFPTSSEPFADLASTHTCCRWPLLLQSL